LPSVASASEMAPPTARAGSSREQPWADRAPWGLQTTEDRGRSRELRREPVRGAACQSGMHQFVWCSGTHRVAWRSTMPETVALAILRFGSGCNRAIWINSHCWERSHLGRVAKGLGALARGPNQASVQRPGVSDLWLSPPMLLLVVTTISIGYRTSSPKPRHTHDDRLATR
jgi:hypothetical protein